MTAPVHLTAQNFEHEVTHSPQPVLVDFWAEWCAPCRMIAPIVAALAEEYAGKLAVAKLDVDELPELADRYGVRSIPTLGVFVGGQLVRRIVGYVPRAELTRQLDALLRTLSQRGIASANA